MKTLNQGILLVESSWVSWSHHLSIVGTCSIKFKNKIIASNTKIIKGFYYNYISDIDIPIWVASPWPSPETKKKGELEKRTKTKHCLTFWHFRNRIYYFLYDSKQFKRWAMELGIIRLKLHTPTTHSRRSLKASDGARSQGATKKRHPVRTVPSRN